VSFQKNSINIHPKASEENVPRGSAQGGEVEVKVIKPKEGMLIN